MSGQGAKSEQENQSQFDQNVWGPSGEAMQNLYGQVGSLFDSTVGAGGAQQNQAGQDFSQGAMEKVINPWQDQMQGGAYKDMNLQNNLTKTLSQSLNNPSAMQEINSMIMGGDGNNYADAMKNQYVDDANRATDNMLANLDSRAAASGMSGGARQGVATARGMDDINRNLQSNLAQTGFGAFDKDLDRKLAIAGQADQNTFGRQQLMSNMIGQQQDTANQGIQQGGNMIGYGSQQQMLPWQQTGAYANAIGGPQILSSGSGSGSGKSLSGGGGVIGSGG